MLAVGYSDQSKAFIVRNSWGDKWVRACQILYHGEEWRVSVFQGDQGYCYIPYEYLTDANLCFDVWTIRQIATDDFGRDHWDNRDRINYLQSNANRFLNYNYTDDRSRVIEAVNEDDDDDSMSDSPWDEGS